MHSLHQPALPNQSQRPQPHRCHHRPCRRLPADQPTSPSVLARDSPRPFRVPVVTRSGRRAAPPSAMYHHLEVTRRRRSSPAQKRILGPQASEIYPRRRACRPGLCRAWDGACALEGRAIASCSRMARRSRLTWMRNEWRWLSLMALSSDIRCANAARAGKSVIE